MAEIHFEADLDSSKLETSIEQSNQKIKDFVKTTEEAGQKGDKAFNGISGALSEMAISLVGAAALLGALKQGFEETTGGQLALTAAGAAYKQLLYNIASGSSSWQANIGNAIKTASEEFDLLLEKSEMEIEAQKKMVFYQEEYVKALMATKPEDKITAAKDAIKYYNEAIDIQQAAVQKQIDLTAKAGLEHPSQALVIQLNALKEQWFQLQTSREQGVKRLDRMVASTEESEFQKTLENIRKGADSQIELDKEVAAEKQKLIGMQGDLEEAQLRRKNISADNPLATTEQSLLALRDKYAVDINEYGITPEKRLALDEKYTEDSLGIWSDYYKQLTDDKINAVKLLMGVKLVTGLLPSGGTSNGTMSSITGSAASNASLSTADILNRVLVKGAGSKDATTLAKDVTHELTAQEKEQKLILDDAIQFTDQLISQLNLTQAQKEAMSFMTSTVKELASGNYIGAALGIVAKIVGALGELGKVDTGVAFKKQLDAWDALITREEKLVELSMQIGGGEKALRDEIASLQKELDAEKARLATLNDRRGNESTMSRNTDPALLAQINDSQDKLNAAEQALNEYLTGTSTSKGIADAIEQGFESGKTSAADFADTFSDFMRTAINSSLEEMSKPKIADWYAKFAEDMASGGGLTDAERVSLKAQWDKIIAEGEANRQAAYAAAGIDMNTGSTTGTTTNTGLSGQIARNITEDTASELTGLWRRATDDIRQSKDYSLAGVNHLVGIENNTFQTVVQLQLAVTELKNITTNTKQVPVASL